jgi:pimeloyl-ACP methyl ester carboxylesterase
MITFTPVATTGSGTALPATTFTLQFNSLYNEPSSLSKLAGLWIGPTGVVTSINSDGTFFSQDPASGCVVNGRYSIINASYNVYAGSETFASCEGHAAVLNGLTATGLITLDDTVAPNQLAGGASVRLPGGAVIVVASTATKQSIDPVAVTLISQADVQARREALIVETWGTTTLPETLPLVTTVPNPFGSTLPDVDAVYAYRAAMSNGQVNYSDLYLNSHSNGRVVIMNMGHQNVAYWPQFADVLPMMVALLAHGFSIYAMNMPANGNSSAHDALFATYGSAAMQYFLEPAVQAMNYWEEHRTFSQVDFVGISGGGWTGVVLQALDTRVKTSILVSGSLPGTQFCCDSFPLSQLPSQGDAEQSWAPFYSIAGYVDLYLMGANGRGREQLQILMVNADCCFGPLQWNSVYAAANYGRDWFQHVRYYESLIQNAPIPSDFSVVEDFTSTAHELTDPFIVQLALNTLLSNDVSVPQP